MKARSAAAQRGSGPGRNGNGRASGIAAAVDVPDRLVLAEETRQLYGGLPAVLPITVLAAIVLAFAHWSHEHGTTVLVWLAAFGVMALARVLLWLAWRRGADLPDRVTFWYRWYAALSIGSALVWGSGAWVLLVRDEPQYQALVAFTIAGLAAGAVVHQGVRWQLAWAFLLAALLPFVLRFATLDSDVSAVTALLSTLFLAAMLMMSVQRSRRTRERLRARLALAEQYERSRSQQRRFRSLVESTNAILWEGDPETFAFNYVSPEAETLLGYPSASWTAEPDFWRRHMHPDDRERAVEYCKRATRELRKYTFDYRMLAADGRVVWLRDVVNVLVRGGRAEKLVGVMIDISQLKDAQQNLEYVSGLQQLLVDASRRLFEIEDEQLDGAFDETLARIGRWCDVDRAYLIWFSPDLERYSNTHEWVADGISAQMHNLQDVPSTTIPRLLERLRSRERVILSDIEGLGDEWAAEKALFAEEDIRSLVALPIFSGDMLAGLIGFDSVRRRRAWDDEEVALLQALGDLIGVARERAEKSRALKASERLRRHAEALADMGSWEWEVGSETFRASSEWRRVTGCGSGPLSRRQVLELTPEPDRARVLEALQRTVETGVSYAIEHRILRADNGEERWLAVHGELVDDAGGRRWLRGFAQDITARKSTEDKLFQLAHYDSLTALPNRVLMLDRLQQALKSARRNGARVAVLFIDLDQFKKVNDTLGHDAGDRVLVDAGERLVSLFREPDTVARIGGDEFVVVLEDVRHVAQITAGAARILDAFRKPLATASREFVLTASVGIAVAPHDGATARDLMRNADTAMYHAKQDGRNAYQFFTRSMNESVQRMLSIEEALRGAVERDELSLHYQPLIRLSDRACVGAEALVRWRHEDLGAVSPEEFIGVAEQAGLIVPIGDFVIRSVIRQVAEWRRLRPSFCVSINVSPRQFRDADIAETVRRELAGAGLSGTALEVEVTEGLLLPERSGIQQALASLRSQGVGLVMDDFGTGYASLRYLRDHPFSSLKIDRGFIRDVDRHPRNRQLVVSALRLGQALDMKVVAEGVETDSELAVLAGEGCELVQGFLFSEPVPPHRLTALLRDEGRASES